ncbi:hypothetical protein PTTG_29340 [Puccinia triticina 1-1 BBBD Race 1]|uniref:Uncharacterized protein n=1 Tax=Puccinia triticina (isolate 1-1 / race 1 (BBBD)) TaxID=630390 RepID=A0A180G4V2_PUCT1|nr:hypothetical protein PTTG_29340 [Puccinia triticina 1-1 BBBD Race 1]
MVVDSPEPEPQSAHDLMNQTEAELAADAAKYSKRSMSDADRTFFTQFFIKQRKELCVQAIERGVSMPMVDRYLGRRMAIKKPNRWNRFMKTTGARAVFRGRRKGVKHRPAMGGVSDLYWELSPEETASFADPPPPETLIPADDPNNIILLRKSQLLPRLNGVNVRQYHSNKPRIMYKILWKAGSNKLFTLPRAATVKWFFLPSPGTLGHTFQFTQTTHGATAFTAAARNIDGERHYPARMQAYLTGYGVAEIAAYANTRRCRIKDRPVSAKARMSQLVAEKTNGAMTTWPWTKTDFKLAKIKYRLVLLPGAKIQASWIKSPSRNLHTAPKTILHTDLDDKLIDVVYDPTIPDGISSDYVLTPEFLKAPLPSSSCSRSSPSSSTPSLHSDDDMSSDE